MGPTLFIMLACLIDWYNGSQPASHYIKQIGLNRRAKSNYVLKLSSPFSPLAMLTESFNMMEWSSNHIKKLSSTSITLEEKKDSWIINYRDRWMGGNEININISCVLELQNYLTIESITNNLTNQSIEIKRTNCPTFWIL